MEPSGKEPEGKEPSCYKQLNITSKKSKPIKTRKEKTFYLYESFELVEALDGDLGSDVSES